MCYDKVVYVEFPSFVKFEFIVIDNVKYINVNLLLSLELRENQ